MSLKNLGRPFCGALDFFSTLEEVSKKWLSPSNWKQMGSDDKRRRIKRRII
jgi:hypothetical protein